jgi:hypothetical protein
MDPLKLTLITSWIHQAYAVYNMNSSTLRCLHYGPNTLTLLTVWGHQTDAVYIMALVNLRCLQNGPIQPFLQPDKHKPDTTLVLL